MICNYTFDIVWPELEIRIEKDNDWKRFLKKKTYKTMIEFLYFWFFLNK